MTKKERKERAAIKKRLQAEGVIPLDKPKVNRKKYVAEISDKLTEKGAGYDFVSRIAMHIISDVKAYAGLEAKISDDTLAYARAIDLVMREAEFMERLRAEGRDKYTHKEYYDEVYSKVYPVARYAKKGEQKND